MDVERVRFKVTLKAGNKLWKEGTVLDSPLPSEVASELRANTGTVEVLARKSGKKEKPAVEKPKESEKKTKLIRRK